MGLLHCEEETAKKCIYCWSVWIISCIHSMHAAVLPSPLLPMEVLYTMAPTRDPYAFYLSPLHPLIIITANSMSTASRQIMIRRLMYNTTLRHYCGKLNANL